MSAWGTAPTRRRASVLRCERLTKTYGDGPTAVDALRDVHLVIETGAFVVVLGPSGSGKTSLLNACGAIEPPTSGRIVAGGRDLATLDDAGRTAFRREHVGFVFQFFNLVPTLTARENVELVAELTGDQPARRAERALRAVDLGDRMDHFPSELSGGEQQRVGIARALAKGPRLLLCDEPTGSLDAETGRRVLAILREVNRRGRRTIVCVTHNREIGRMADRVVEMRSGEVVDSRVVPEPVEASELRW